MWGFFIGTMYKYLGITFTNGCDKSIFHKDSSKEDMSHIVPLNKTILWHQRQGHIGEKGLRALHGKCMVEGRFDF